MINHGIVPESDSRFVHTSQSAADMDAALGLVRDEAGDAIVPEAQRRFYTERQLVRNASYSGPASIWDEDEANVILSELLSYFGRKLPAPPLGLPGRNGLPTQKIMRVIRLGFEYLEAVVDKRPGRQWSTYQEIEETLRQEYWRGRKAGENQTERVYIDQPYRQISFDPRPDTSLVYFIGSESGPVKIGKAVNPDARLKTLQTGHHERLTILATCAGGGERERQYHQQYADHRLAGEWFTRCPEIESEIARLGGVA